jgi:hypothetical protein
MGRADVAPEGALGYKAACWNCAANNELAARTAPDRRGFRVSAIGAFAANHLFPNKLREAACFAFRNLP